MNTSTRLRRLTPLVPALLATLAMAGCATSAAAGSTGTGPAIPAVTDTTPTGATETTASEVPTVPADPASPDPATPPLPSPTSETPQGSSVDRAALDVLATLPVKGRAPMTGYDRSACGQAWSDIDRNGCDQRNDVLGRDLVEITFKPGTRDCLVLTGQLLDPYSGRVLTFQRGASTSSAVQIDHVVALANAWVTGAQTWTPQQRERFANDPLVLLAVDGPLNQQKGAGDAATWLPPNKSYRCAYVARQVAIKATYGLWVTPPEKDAITRVLTACPDHPVPTAAEVTTARPPAGSNPSPTSNPATVPTQTATPAPVSKPKLAATTAPQAAPEDGAGESVSYRNCAAVRAAGKAPLHAGDPGYSRKLDRDGDGVACES